MSERAIVVGAGIAGLTAGFRLKEAGFAVTVLEAGDHVGGWMATIERDGFRLDTAAAILPTTYTRMVSLIADAGLSAEVVPTSDLVGILREGTVHRVRSHAKGDGLTTKLLSPAAKLRMVKMVADLVRAGDRLDWYDLGRAADLDTETARQYADRRLNREILDWIIDPALGALFVASPDRLSVVDFLFAIRTILGGAFLSTPQGGPRSARACSPATGTPPGGTSSGTAPTTTSSKGPSRPSTGSCPASATRWSSPT